MTPHIVCRLDSAHPGTSCCRRPQGGKRIVGFIIGGATRSEVRVAHQLAGKLGRDVTLGATSIDTPAGFLAHMRSLSGAA